MSEWKIGNKTLHVAVNWNAIRNYCQIAEINEISRLDKVLSFGLDEVLTMAWCCVREGERLAGNSFDVSEEDLGAIVGPADMANFLRIYIDLSTAKIPGAPATPTGEKKTIAP